MESLLTKVRLTGECQSVVKKALTPEGWNTGKTMLGALYASVQVESVLALIGDEVGWSTTAVVRELVRLGLERVNAAQEALESKESTG